MNIYQRQGSIVSHEKQNTTRLCIILIFNTTLGAVCFSWLSQYLLGTSAKYPYGVQATILSFVNNNTNLVMPGWVFSLTHKNNMNVFTILNSWFR